MGMPSFLRPGGSIFDALFPANQVLYTEAALDAVQRMYPQIYKSVDQLLLKQETIDVQVRDFTISVHSKGFSIRHRAWASFNTVRQDWYLLRLGPLPVRPRFSLHSLSYCCLCVGGCGGRGG